MNNLKIQKREMGGLRLAVGSVKNASGISGRSMATTRQLQLHQLHQLQPQLQLQLPRYNYNNINYSYNYNYTTLQHNSHSYNYNYHVTTTTTSTTATTTTTPHYTTLHPAVVVRWPLQTLQKAQLQPPFDRAVRSAIHASHQFTSSIVSRVWNFRHRLGRYCWW